MDIPSAKAKAFNINANITASQAGGGCVVALMCEKCETINSGTCLCMGIFTCKNCGYEHDRQKQITNSIAAATFAKAKHDFPPGFFKKHDIKKHDINPLTRRCRQCGLSDIECIMEHDKSCLGYKRDIKKEIENDLGELTWL